MKTASHKVKPPFSIVFFILCVIIISVNPKRKVLQMFLMVRRVGAVLALLFLTACVSAPMSTSHQHDTADGTHRGVQISMHSGVMGTPVQTVMLVYSRWNSQPVAIVSGQSLQLGDRLLDALLDLGPSIVTGEYLIRADDSDCPPGSLCGTLVQVNSSAGANANADAAANGTNTVTAGSRSPDPLLLGGQFQIEIPIEYVGS
jgi:hypothetical protein